MVVISLIAGPSFIPITEVRCVSVSFGKQEPSIRLSENSLKEINVKAFTVNKSHLYHLCILSTVTHASHEVSNLLD